jgi:hypothetical protein
MRDEDNQFHYSVLPIDEFSVDHPIAPSAETQQTALDDIEAQFVKYMKLARDDPDPWKAIQIISNAERILDEYVSAGFDRLAPFQAAVQRDLWNVWRCVRRQFLWRALLSPAHEFPRYLATARDPKLGLDGPDADADFAIGTGVCHSLTASRAMLGAHLRPARRSAPMFSGYASRACRCAASLRS